MGCPYFQLDIWLVRSRGRWHRIPAGQLVLLDFAQHRLDVDNRRAIDCFDWADSETVLSDPTHRDLMHADWIGPIR